MAPSSMPSRTAMPRHPSRPSRCRWRTPTAAATARPAWCSGWCADCTSRDALQAQLQAQKQILAQARQRYSEDHPDVKRIERQIKSLQTRMAAGETNSANVVGSPAVVQLKTQINALDTQLAGLDRRGNELR